MYALSQQATESSCLSVSHWNKQQHTCAQAKCKFPTMDISAFVGNHFLMTRYKWPPAEQQGPTVVHFDGWTASRENVIPKFVRWELRGGRVVLRPYVCTYVRMYVCMVNIQHFYITAAHLRYTAMTVITVIWSNHTCTVDTRTWHGGPCMHEGWWPARQCMHACVGEVAKQELVQILCIDTAWFIQATHYPLVMYILPTQCNEM